MKKTLLFLMVLAASTAFSACSDASDNHGVIFNHEGFLSGLFGAAPVQSVPAPAQLSPLAAPATAMESPRT